MRHSNPGLALEQCERGYALAQKSSQQDWNCRFRFLYAELLLDQSPETTSKVRELVAFQPAAGDHLPETLTRMWAVRGYAEQRSGDWERAEELYDRSFSGLSFVDDPCWRAELFIHHQAQTLLHLERTADAAQKLSQAMPDAEACPDRYWEALDPFVQGNLCNHVYRYEEAITCFDKCLLFSRRANIQILVPLSLGNLAVAYQNVGDHAKAVGVLNEIEAYYKQLGHLQPRQFRDWGEDEGHRARSYYAMARYDEAVREYKDAIRIAFATHDDLYVTRFNDELTSLYLERGDYESADQLNRHVLDTVDRRYEFPVAASAQLNSARLLRYRGQFSIAYEALKQLQHALLKFPDPKLTWQTHVELAHTLASLERFDQARLEFVTALNTAESARRSIMADGYRLTYFSQLLSLYQSYIAFLADRGDVSGALSAAESAHARLLAEKLNGSSAPNGSADFTHLARDKRAVLLSYSVGSQHSYLWVTTWHGSKMFSVPPKAEIEKDVKRLNEMIAEERDLTQEPQFGRMLYEKLIAPAAAVIPPGADIIIIPDGPLSDLNFETLIPPSSPPRYWLESASITVAPSLTLLNREQQRGIRPNRLLLVGAPVNAEPELGPLPGAARELEEIQQLFGAQKCLVLAGADATPARFKGSSPGRYSVIHFSAHAVPNRDSPLDSAIILSGDRDNHKLFAHDLAGIQLNADLVTLSACQSAGAKNIPGEGLVGLTWAVLRAGAGNVIASLWKVPDEASYELMARLYSHIAAGETLAHALHNAKLEMITQRKSVPYDWAAFQLYSR
ncbi:MAG: CHAT domain-containing protein [Acidobacteriaceae bacterium]|nr:CHAT domain-containing protein [Acidobacteriaceae bacterium]